MRPPAGRPESIKAVQDPARLRSGERLPNTSAFEPPARVPEKLEALNRASRKTLVDKLIQEPAPLPPESVVKALKALEPPVKRFHGAKMPLLWFPVGLRKSPCRDMFGYMFRANVRNASKLPFNSTVQALLGQLGELMGDPGRDTGADSVIPAGYTYFGQFVDHDITLDVSSVIEAAQDAEKITNMRTPALDLDSVYGRGPALEPYLYKFPTGGVPPTAVKLQLGTNRNFGPGGPLNGSGTPVIPNKLRCTARFERHRYDRDAGQHLHRHHRRSPQR